MPTASRNVRKHRRVKRERTLAFRALAQMNYNFEQLRTYAQGLRVELEAANKALKPKDLVITRFPDDEEDNSE